MLARTINQEAYFQRHLEDTPRNRKQAYRNGISDYRHNQTAKKKLINPYPESSALFNAYEAAYINKERYSN